MRPITLEKVMEKLIQDSKLWTPEEKKQVRDEMLQTFFGRRDGELIQ